MITHPVWFESIVWLLPIKKQIKWQTHTPYSVLPPSATCSVVIGCLLRYRVIVCMKLPWVSIHDTFTNETEARGRRKKLGQTNRGWQFVTNVHLLKQCINKRIVHEEEERMVHSSPQTLKLDRAPLLLTKPNEASNSAEVKTVKCRLELEIELVFELTAITCSLPLLGNQSYLWGGTCSQSARILKHLHFGASLIAHFTFKHLTLTLPLDFFSGRAQDQLSSPPYW